MEGIRNNAISTPHQKNNLCHRGIKYMFRIMFQLPGDDICLNIYT